MKSSVAGLHDAYQYGFSFSQTTFNPHNLVYFFGRLVFYKGTIQVFKTTLVVANDGLPSPGPRSVQQQPSSWLFIPE